MTDFMSPRQDGGRGEHTSSRHRTRAWVQHTHVPHPDIQFYSPSVPPSPLDDSEAYYRASADSDNDSSDSAPPPMTLRYSDGRDRKISQKSAHTPAPSNHVSSHHSRTRVPSAGHTSHSRSRSAAALPPRIITTASHLAPREQTGPVAPQLSRAPFPTPLAQPIVSHPIRPHTAHPLSLRPQENIRVLPTGQAPPYPHNSRPSLVSPAPQRAFVPSNHTLLGASQVAAAHSEQPPHVRNSPAPAPISYSQSHPPTKHASNLARNPSAPTSRYPPYGSSKHSRHTQPSGGYVHGGTYPHPDSHFQRPSRAGFGTRSRTPATGPYDSWPVIDEDARVNRRREPRSGRYRRRGSSSSLSSDTPPLDPSGSQTPSSNSTYYVSASPGPKVKQLAHEKSTYTPTSSTKSPNSGSSGGCKKQFFSWFFGNNDKKNPQPLPSNKGLFRRRSTGGGLKGG